MQHMTLKAAVATTTDRGIFEAVISTDAVDRENDIVEPAAMVEALNAWTFTGKMVPLHWNHSSEPEDIVGHVNPTSVKAVNGEVHATGWIDQSTDCGQHVWRLAKSGTIGFSFGYMVVNSSDRKGGGKHITKLDVFEVSATPAPMNPDTRVLNTKALEDEDEDRIPSHAAIERMLVEEGIISSPASAAAYERADVDSTFTGTGQNGHHRETTKAIDARLAAESKMLNAAWARAEKVARLTATTGVYPADTEPDTKSIPPIQIASFDA
jgi:HK97 family phage prohead protease